MDAHRTRVVDDDTPVSDTKVPQLAALLRNAVASAMDAANPLVEQASRDFAALPALIRDDDTVEPLGEGAAKQLEVEHEVELTITAVEEAPVCDERPLVC